MASQDEYKSAGTTGNDTIEQLSDIEVLKDKISGLEILVAALEEYVVSDKQNSSFVVSSDLQSGQRRVVEYEQIQRIAHNFEMMKSELSAMDEEHANLERDFTILNAEYEKLKTAHQALEERLMNASSVLTAVEHEKGNMKQDYETKLINLNDEYEKLKTAHQNLEERLKNAYSDLTKAEGEKENMKKDLDEYLINNENLETTNTGLHESLRSCSAELTAAVEENENMKKEYDKKHKTLSADYEKLQIHNTTLEEQLMKWKAYYLEVQKERENMQNNYKLLWDKHEKQKKDLHTAHRKLEVENNKSKQARADMENLKQEKETLLTRLSKLIGDRLTHGNANIADLSDAGRPTKLSECFSEIYDNEWTDAFEELTAESRLSDDHAIRRLLDILMNAFRKCKEITWDRYESLSLIASTLHVKDENAASAIITDSQEAVIMDEHLNTPPASTVDSPEDKMERETQTEEAVIMDEHLNTPPASTVDSPEDKMERETQTEESMKSKTTPLNSTLSIDEKTSLKNIWRSSTFSLRNESLTLIYAMLSTGLRTPETNMPKTYKYLKVCCDVCWKMFMQEKPMQLEINAEKQSGQEQLFDTERFRAYTKAGKYVAYVVWPALFLHEGGPMLAKGIAQGCNKVQNS